jgi:ADP-ribose pyrophosphatase YjhB (NUDIX family)
MMEELLNEKLMINKFNIRVYGIALNESNELLLCNEDRDGINFTKFPGGGLEYGEGILDCLHREFREELNVEIEIIKHFYTTDFFQQSAFVKTEQVISIYYLVKLKTLPEKMKISITPLLDFFWQPHDLLNEDLLTFPIDKLVAGKLIHNIY